MLKRIVPLVFLVMVVVMVGGCGNDSDNNRSNATAQSPYSPYGGFPYNGAYPGGFNNFPTPNYPYSRTGFDGFNWNNNSYLYWNGSPLWWSPGTYNFDIWNNSVRVGRNNNWLNWWYCNGWDCDHGGF